MSMAFDDKEKAARLLNLTLSSFAWVEHPVVEVFPHLRELGIGRLQLLMEPGHFEGSEEECVELEKACTANNIWIASVHAPIGQCDLTSMDFEVWQQTEASYLLAMKLASRFKSRYIVIHPRLNPIDPFDEDEALDLMAERLMALKRQSRLYGVEICLENLPGEDLAADYGKLISLRPPQFCLDFGHANMNGDPAYGLMRLGTRLSMLHIHDNLGVNDEHLLPGEGNIDWPRMEKQLREVNFQGEYCLEAKHPDGPEPVLRYFMEISRRNTFYLENEE